MAAPVTVKIPKHIRARASAFPGNCFPEGSELGGCAAYLFVRDAADPDALKRLTRPLDSDDRAWIDREKCRALEEGWATMEAGRRIEIIEIWDTPSHISRVALLSNERWYSLELLAGLQRALGWDYLRSIRGGSRDVLLVRAPTLVAEERRVGAIAPLSLRGDYFTEGDGWTQIA